MSVVLDPRSRFELVFAEERLFSSLWISFRTPLIELLERMGLGSSLGAGEGRMAAMVLGRTVSKCLFLSTSSPCR